MDWLHDQKIHDGKVCFSQHTHYAAGSSLKEAIRRWEGFTAWEYGGAWGRWQNAWAKTVSCAKNRCEITGRPCRRR